MARRNESPEEKRRRELVQGFLKDNPIKDPNDIRELMKEIMRQVLQGGLEGELDEELGYTRYDYRNKETENSRNGFSKKTMHTSIGDMEIDVPRDRQGEFEPRLVRKHQNYHPSCNGIFAAITSMTLFTFRCQDLSLAYRLFTACNVIPL